MTTKQTEQDVADPQPEHVGVCRNPECEETELRLFKPLEQVPVMCRCGQLLSPEQPKQ